MLRELDTQYKMQLIVNEWLERCVQFTTQTFEDNIHVHTS
jgi:hypothetical protein